MVKLWLIEIWMSKQWAICKFHLQFYTHYAQLCSWNLQVLSIYPMEVQIFCHFKNKWKGKYAKRKIESSFLVNGNCRNKRCKHVPEWTPTNDCITIRRQVPFLPLFMLDYTLFTCLDRGAHVLCVPFPLFSIHLCRPISYLGIKLWVESKL